MKLYFLLCLISLCHAGLDSAASQKLIPAVESGFPTLTSTDLSNYDGEAECIADRARLRYFGYPQGTYIHHCKCWTADLQPGSPNFREDWFEVNLWEPKLVTEVAVQGCTEFQGQYVSAFKIAYTLNGQDWLWIGHRNRWREFKGMHHAASVVRTQIDQPFKARKVRFFPTKCETLQQEVPICTMRFEVYFQDLPTEFQALMAKPKVYQRLTNDLP
ncbi:hypothetical protein FGO68_gene12428 [Halteria grandinella]|uniref:F5/8 type C domain-containing protein n=1 Tax=Halteria grandinella TaxID=5974 RepID=A0A8J8NIV6_HALGN|nr:hypothetical protein FGO68_gene12428 [Halteria grandinella]